MPKKKEASVSTFHTQNPSTVLILTMEYAKEINKTLYVFSEINNKERWLFTECLPSHGCPYLRITPSGVVTLEQKEDTR